MRIELGMAVWLCTHAAAGGQGWVRETARDIPIARHADVVVVGGSAGAVAAAAEAARRGAKVFLLAPRLYLGEDLCARMRLWPEPGARLDTPLARALFTPPDRKPSSSAVPPLHIKKTLDQTLAASSVEYLLGSLPSDVLRDRAGALAGIVMVNRSGRQAVVAKVIVDATDRSVVARAAGARFQPFPSGVQVFRRIVLDGRPAAGERILARHALGEKAVEYELSIPMPDASFASFAEAEQIARDVTDGLGQSADTEEIFQTPPDPLVAQGGQGIAAHRPAGLARLLVLASGSLPDTASLIRAGTLVGGAAAVEAAASSVAAPVVVEGRPQPGALDAEVRETLEGTPRHVGRLGAVPSPERALPVLGSFDVVVVGGGTGGAPAAIAAARKGASTLVIEFQHALGGVGTVGFVRSYYWGYRGGFSAQVPTVHQGWDALEKSDWLRRQFRQAGGRVWYGATGCGAVVRHGRVAGVVVATPLGRGVVLARAVVDSTGNADIAAAAGASTLYTSGAEIAQQGAGVSRAGNRDYTIVDETDVEDVSHLFAYSMNRVKGFDLGVMVASRERRRIAGDYVMSPLDALTGRTFPDTIAVAYSNYDTHGYTVDPFLMLHRPAKEGFLVRVPYRCLLPQGLDGILVTGLGISAHRDAIPLVRMQPDIQNQGYAAGVAAAMAARAGTGTRAVDVQALRKALAADDVLPEWALDDPEPPPPGPERLRQAVRDAGNDFEDLALVFNHRRQSLPLLREAYHHAASDAARLNYALILAFLNDGTGVPRLIAALDSSSWDEGWEYGVGTIFKGDLSRVDKLVIGLGLAGGRSALPAILRKVRTLDAAAGFSHHRAVALALERLADPSAAPDLAALLAKPGMTGYWTTTVEEARALDRRNPSLSTPPSWALLRSLREIGLARALYRCGDAGGAGRRILSKYAADLRGHFARHARAVLEVRP